MAGNAATNVCTWRKNMQRQLHEWVSRGMLGHADLSCSVLRERSKDAVRLALC
jgi:hypothetical protein